MFSAFPAGRPGIGLLVLRAAVGVAAAVEGSAYVDIGAGPTAVELCIGLTLIAGGLSLLAGFLTPVAATSVSVCAAGLAARWLLVRPPSDLIDGPSLVLVSIVALALALLGPGAHSLDSRLFGRREIVLTAGTLKRDTQS